MQVNRTKLTVTALLAVGLAIPALGIAGDDDDREKGHHSYERHREKGKERRLNVQLGPRPYYLVEDMDNGKLKRELQKCSEGPFEKTDFSIGHRGAALQFPEHTKESYEAAARMGAGIVECDVTFTKDRELVCRHSQCDLHTTTDILLQPELAAKCSVPPDVVDGELLNPGDVKCCTSDITLAEFKTLCGKMDAANTSATTIEEYVDATPSWRTDLYATCGTVLSHAESIRLFQDLGVKMTPELKSPSVQMPYEEDYTQEDYAQQMIDEYKTAGVDPSSVWAQSFNIGDVLYWIDNEPAFGEQAVYLDDANEPAELPTAEELSEYKDAGINIVAPPMWALLDVRGHKVVPSEYALDARAAGLDIITWTLERSGPLVTGGGWYYQTITDVTDNDGDTMVALDVLAQDVGIIGIFSDWPATVTYYANCMDL